jgi:hypothetical protein
MPALVMCGGRGASESEIVMLLIDFPFLLLNLSLPVLLYLTLLSFHTSLSVCTRPTSPDIHNGKL